MQKGSCNEATLKDSNESPKAETQNDSLYGFSQVLGSQCSIMKQRLQSLTEAGSDIGIIVQERRAMAGTAVGTLDDLTGGLDSALFNDSSKAIALNSKPVQLCMPRLEEQKNLQQIWKQNKQASLDKP